MTRIYNPPPEPEFGSADWLYSMRVTQHDRSDWIIENDWCEYEPSEPIPTAEAAWRWIDRQRDAHIAGSNA